MSDQYLYFFDRDLYRLGNSTSPKLDLARSADVNTFHRNSIEMVRANGIGISLGTLEYLHQLRFSGWVWKFAAKTPLVKGLVIVPDPDRLKSGHFFLCPAVDMPMEKMPRPSL